MIKYKYRNLLNSQSRRHQSSPPEINKTPFALILLKHVRLGTAPLYDDPAIDSGSCKYTSTSKCPFTFQHIRVTLSYLSRYYSPVVRINHLCYFESLGTIRTGFNLLPESSFLFTSSRLTRQGPTTLTIAGVVVPSGNPH